MVYNTNKFEIRILHDSDGLSWLLQWLESLEVKDQAIIMRRLGRVRQGNLGDYRSLGDGIFEFRFHTGAGFRIYWSFLGKEVIIVI